MMNEAERQLLEDRQTRAEARAVFDARRDRIKSALSGQSLTRRLSCEALIRSRGLANDGLAIARESRWIIAATVLGLAGWTARRPLLRGARVAWQNVSSGEQPSFPRRLRQWIKTKVRS